LMEHTRIYKALQGVRGRPPVPLAALEQLLVQFSRLVVEQRWVREIDINPLLVSHEGLIALDARVVLQPPDLSEAELPTPSIRPYPSQYASYCTLKDGSQVFIRPIRPEDEPKIVRFHHTLSEGSVRLRYFTPMKLSQRVAHERLTRICFIDYDREMALVVEGDSSEPGGPREILGIGRLSKRRGTDEAEFALLVSDRHQRKGIGEQLLGRLLQIAKAENLQRVTADILNENTGMVRICQRYGFHVEKTDDVALLHAWIVLS
jgi:acetyltransferase